MYKKYRSWLLCLACLCSLLCGCNATTEQEKGSIEISVWHYYGDTAEETFAYLVQRFNQTVGLEEGIVVTAYGFDGVSQLAEAVDASASGVAGASPLPSIFAAYADSVVPLYNQGVVANLDDYFTQEELSTYYAPFVEEGRLGTEESLVILPIAKSTEVLHLNKTAFDRFAAETGFTYDDLSTWEGLTAVSEAYYQWTDAQTETLNDGKAFYGSDGMANFMIVGTKQLGNDMFVDVNGVMTHQFTEDIAHKIWDVYYVPYVQGYYTTQASYCSDDVSDGTLVAYVGSTASSYYFPSQSLNIDGQWEDIECLTLPYPVFDSGDNVVVQQGAGMVITASTVEQEAASAVFLKWFTQEENNGGFAVSTGYMPVKNEVLNVEYIMAEMSRDSSPDLSLPIVQSNYTTYEQLETYTMYTSAPFIGSEDARDILEYSLSNKIEDDIGSYLERMMTGITYQEAVELLLSESNFQSWYMDIDAQLTAAINP